MAWLLWLSAGLVTALWLYWRYRNRRLLDMARKIRGPMPLPVLGNALKFMWQPEGTYKVFKDLIVEYGDMVRFWLGPELNIVLSNPDDVKTLLTSSKTSIKGPQYRYMADVLGNGILSGSGPIWRRHRKLANPNYGKQATESYGDTFNQEADLLLQKLRPLADGQEIDVYQHIVQTTSYAVCQTLMGLTKDETMSLPYLQEIIEETPRLYDVVFARMTKWWYQINPIFYLSGLYKTQKRFIEMKAEFTKSILLYRKKHLRSFEYDKKLDLMNAEEDSLKNTQLSVIDRFILSQEFSFQDLLDDSFTIFASSQEASAKIASALLLMMAYHPQCQKKLYEEILSVMGEEDRSVTTEDLKVMPYLDMSLKEVLRLYPIGAVIQRSIAEDFTLSSGTIPAGSSLVFPICFLMRDPRHWVRPDEFDPERFTPENCRQRNSNCYVPFSLGPMDCLGRYFGIKIVKTICVRVLREFSLSSSSTYEDSKMIISISAIPESGFHVKLKPRNKLMDKPEFIK